MGTGLVSPWHIAILAIVLLIAFGPKRLPEMGRSLGKGLREFKDSLSETHQEHDPQPNAKDDPSALPTPSSPPAERDLID